MGTEADMGTFSGDDLEISDMPTNQTDIRRRSLEESHSDLRRRSLTKEDEDPLADDHMASPVDRSPSASPSPDDEPDSEQERSDDEDFPVSPGGTSLLARQGASSFGGRRGDNLLDFIDEVSDGISSYLGFLEERQKGVVYDRHEQAETLRFREYLRQFHSTTMKRATEDAPPAVQTAEPFSALDRPCPPPKDVHFETPQRMPDGKDRLAFSACFECGNLALAKSDSATQYTLLLDFDVNTSGYTQWFYFGVRGGFKGLRVTFKIVNMSKADSHFSRGMLPVLWSETAARGWERGCSDVSYYANEHKRGRSDGEHSSHFHTLEFSYTFEHGNDTVFFAYHYPYTYSYLQDLIGWLVTHPYASKLVRRGTLCRTIGGLACEYLLISDPDSEPSSDEPPKPLAVATARVHPGESNSSWMMQGLLQFLCSPTAEAKALREACTWLVIPMLNPDGVIQGNYRCGLAGADLNRVFSKPHRRLHPTIWHLKERIKFHKTEVYIDLHGHSKKEGVFLYGGHYENNDRKNAEVRLMPRLCSLASDDFKYWQCVFSVQDSKLTTARLVAFLQLNILNAYTVEASFANCGLTETEEDENGSKDCITSEAKKISVARPNTYRRSNSIVSHLSQPTLEGADDSDEDGDGNVHRGLRRHDTGSSFNSQSNFGGSDSDNENKGKGRQMSKHSVLNGASKEPEDQPPAPERPKAEMSASRLELVGPSLLRSLHCSWQLTKGFRKGRSERRCNYGSPTINGVEHVGCSHLHYARLTMNTAREVFTRLLTKPNEEKYISLKRASSTPILEDDAQDKGSDSEPDADEKNPEELKKIHKRLLQKLKKRKDNVSKAEAKNLVAEEDNEPKEFRTIIAFGKTVRIPIVKGHLVSPEVPAKPPTEKRGLEKLSRPRSAPMAARQATADILTSGIAAEETPRDQTGENETAIDTGQSRGARERRLASPFGSRPASGHESASAEASGMRRGPLAIASLVPTNLGPPPSLRRVQSPDIVPVVKSDNVAPEHPGLALARSKPSDEGVGARVTTRMPALEGAATHSFPSGSGGVRMLRSGPARGGGNSSAAEGGGRYAASDVRNFVAVKSIKPQSASHRTAEQFKRGQSGPVVGPGFELPEASTVGAPEKRWTANALHRIPLEKSNANASAPKDNASMAESLRPKSTVTVIGTQRQQRARVVGVGSSKTGRSSPPPPITKARGSLDDKTLGDEEPRRKSVQLPSDSDRDGRMADASKVLGRPRASSIGNPLQQGSTAFGQGQISASHPIELIAPIGSSNQGGPNSQRMRSDDLRESEHKQDAQRIANAGWTCVGPDNLSSATTPGRRTIHWAEEISSSGQHDTQPAWTSLAEKSSAIEVANPVPLSSLLANSSLRPKAPLWMEPRMRPFSEPPLGSLAAEVSTSSPIGGTTCKTESQPHQVDPRTRTVEMPETAQARIGATSRNVRAQSGQPPSQRVIRAQVGQPPILPNRG